MKLVLQLSLIESWSNDYQLKGPTTSLLHEDPKNLAITDSV